MTHYLQDIAPLITVGSETYIIHKGKVLMHKRGESKESFPGFLIGPGGHVDNTEDALKSAIREVKEESGVTINEKDICLKAICFHHHLDRNELFIVFVYRAVIPDYQEVQKGNREGESVWLDINELALKDNVFPPSKYYFDHVFNDKPGILHTNIEFNHCQLVRVLSHTLDANS